MSMGDHPLPVRTRPSWGLTVMTQAALCIGLYAAFNIGKPQIRNNGLNYKSFDPSDPLNGSFDLYFISVVGGFRPLLQQTQLLQQMEKVAKIYKAQFVLNISEHGEEDPLIQNATLCCPSLKLPWYATGATRGHNNRYFLKQIVIPHKQILSIIGLDTGPWKDTLHTEQLDGTVSEGLHWLAKTLAVTDSNWHIVVGVHPLNVCDEEHSLGTIRLYERLHHIFLKYRVNAYLSKQGCSGHYARDGGIAYIGNPSPGEKCRSASVHGTPDIDSEMCDGFLLHRVSPLEIESYFINSAGNTVSRSTLQQWGRDVM